MRFEILSLEDGLSQSVVNCVLQDSRGFLWLGTQAGLNRYDGYEVTVYRHRPEDPSSLPHDWVLSLAEGPAGDLWIGTEGGGLARWRPETDSFITYRHDPDDPESLSDDRIVDLIWDQAGILWIGSFASGLARFDPDSGSFERIRHHPSDPGSLVDDQVRAVYADRRGNLWIGTLGGLDLLGGDRRQLVHFRHDPGDPQSLGDNRVRAIVEDRHGSIWVGTHGGLNRLDPASGTFQRFRHDPAVPGSLSHDWIRALFEDRDGRLWVGTDGGLNLWQPGSGGRFVSYRSDAGDPHSLGSDQIVDIYQDRGGILWVGTLGGGAAKWNPATWSFPHLQIDASAGASNMIFSISQGPDGDLWAGTSGGLARLDRDASGRVTGCRFFTHDPADAGSLGDDRVTALLHSRGGSLWVGTVGGGLHRLGAGGERFEKYRNDPRQPASLSADAVTSLHEDERGRLWIGTLDGGLNLHRGDGTFTRFRHHPADPTSLGYDRVFAIAEDRRGRLWLATDGGGLDRFDPDSGVFSHFRHQAGDPTSLSSDEVITVHVDAADRLWVGTKALGLDRLESLDEASGRAVFHNYSVADGLPDHTIWGILSDRGGYLWLSTNNGLSRFDPRTEKFTNYDSSHGLQAREFNMGAHHRSPGGELFFGGINGLNAFFPDRIHSRDAVPPPVVLTGLTRFNEPMPLARPVFDLDEVELSHRDHFLTFEFAVLDFTAPERNQYRYRLTGLDEAWVALGNERRVTFPSLGSGRYTLMVQGANAEGVWNRDGTSLSIVVKAAPWQSWWAQTLYAATAMAAIWLLVAVQNRKIERERARVREREVHLHERERLIGELERKCAELEHFNYTVSHDLKTPLVTIKGFLGYLRKDMASGDIGHVERDLNHISDAADRMSSLLDDLLAFALVGRQINPPESVELHELAYEARELAAGILGENRVDLEIGRDLPVVSGDRVRLRAVFQNLIENAVKYMGDQAAPRIEIGCRRGDDGGEVVLVRDNGRGIAPRYHAKIFELFERLDADNRGTGVGLALVKRIVELHGGRVWVESEGPGHGSTFCFTVGKLQAETDAGLPAIRTGSLRS
ncbi:MAG: two-component regulator propeller domain-containing protein [Thermoanaerobaculia bacterium]